MHPPIDIDSVERFLDQSDRAVDPGPAVDLIGSIWPSICSVHGSRLRAMIERIPEAAWSDDPWMLAAMGASYRSVDSIGPSGALPWFRAAEALGTDGHAAPIASTVFVHHSAALRSLGHLDAAFEKAESAMTALDVAGPASVRVRCHAQAALQLGLVLLQLGDHAGALPALRLAFGERSLSQSELVECLSGLSLLAYFSGDLNAAADFTVTARSASAASGILTSGFGAGALVAEVLVAVARNERVRALELVEPMSKAASGSDWEPLAHVARASASILDGDFIQGLDHVRHGLECARSCSGDPAVRAMCEMAYGELLMHLGEFGAARAAFAAVEPSGDHTICPGRFLAGIRYKAGDNAGCLDELGDCEALGEEHSAITTVDVLLLRAAANYELGNPTAGDVALDRALLLAAGSGIRSAFLLLGSATLHRMLAHARERSHAPHVIEIMERLRAEQHAPMIGSLEPLSHRERDIARHLSEDKTMGQIASELFISTNTVKTHVRSIYRKLSANNRRDAVRRGTELGVTRISPSPNPP